MSAQNLKTIQNWMKENNVEAFFVPHADMFHGEYVAPHDDKLAWVSGFNGSAGCAIITLNDSYLFVDGRYTLQAKIQSPNFKLFNYSPDTISSFLQSNLKGKTLSYDPWLLSVLEINHLQKNAQLIALDKNPIDLFWTDRPAKPQENAYEYDTKYAGETREEKLQKLRTLMAQNSEEAWFIGDSELVCWLMNIRAQDLEYCPILQCMALITENEVTIFADINKISETLKTKANFNLVALENMAEFIKNQNITITSDPKNTPSVLDCPKKFNFKDNPLYKIRSQKNLVQQNGMRTAHVKDAIAVMEFWRWLEQQKGITEIEAQEYLTSCRQKQDLFSCESFPTISAFKEHGAIVHYRSSPNTNSILDNGLYLCDSGGHYLDGTTDITRVYSIGNAPSEKQKRDYTLVLKGHIALASIHFPKGTFGSQLDILARQNLWRNGTDYAHGTGHGVGNFLNVHEWPGGPYNKGNLVNLEEGMVVSNEPGVYITGEYGIRIENVQMVVTSDINENFYMFETLTLVPYEHNLIQKDLLNLDEINWIKKYYEKIWEKISPLMDNQARDWLKEKLLLSRS